jgi:serine/threonine protein kinase
LSRFRHPNIAALFAYTDPLAEGKAAGYHLVYELAEKGSLDKLLADDFGRSRLGSLRQRVQMAIDVMTALQFLHKGNDQIKTCFHRDVKSANIVLKRDFTAQLIDCGLAKFVKDDFKTTGIKGTKGYICPQYVRTGMYQHACDIYSFGVVMLELWTGRMQNMKDESGSVFNFEEEYVHNCRDVTADADAAMDLGSQLSEFSKKFTDLALRCISERSQYRPTGEMVLKTLKAIFDECSPSSGLLGGNNGGGDVASASSGGADACATCRTFKCVPQHGICAICLCRVEMREVFWDLFSMLQSSRALSMEAFSNKVVQNLGEKLDPKLNVISQQLDGVIERIDAALPVLAHLDRRLNNEIPRTIFLLPADIKSCCKHPRSWLSSLALKKYYLFFVCPVSQQVVSPPIKLKVNQDWFHKAAPVLASGLFLVQVGLKAGLNVTLDLDGAASKLFHFSLDCMRQMLDEFSVILKKSGDDGLMKRLRCGGGNTTLSDKDIRELSGDAYELVAEKAREQTGWRSQMEPVRLPPSPKVFWVAKAVAQDPKYAIVRA